MRMKFGTILLIAIVFDVCFLFFLQQVGFIHTVFADNKSHTDINIRAAYPMGWSSMPKEILWLPMQTRAFFPSRRIKQ